MLKNYFVLLAISILSLRYCETKNVVFGSNDGSYSDVVDYSIRGKLLKKPRFPWNIKDSADLIGRPKLKFDNDLVTIDERKSDGFNGSMKNDEAISHNRSCNSVPCSCVSETGACTCTNIACACIIAPCTINYATGGSTYNSSRASSSSGSSSSDGSSSSSSGSTSNVSSTSSTSSSSLSVSTVCTGLTATAPATTCTCYVTTCLNNVCGATTSYPNTSGVCAG